MKKVKKLVSIALCTVVTTGLLAGCGNKTEDTKDNSNSTSAPKAIDYSKPNEYTWWLMADPNDWYSDYSQNPVVKFFNKKFNTALKIQQPAKGTESNTFNTMMATGDYTDIIDTAHSQTSLTQLHEDGIIIDIAKYLNYMPNLKALIESDPEYKKAAYNDKGQILKVPVFRAKDEAPWGGLVYRADILKTMTGGNVKFPSGNSVPTTIADWDYMLPLYKQYFEAAKMKDYAPLIIPSTGAFGYSNILNGFGANVGYYLNNEKVKYGPLDDGYYNYLVKMREWYKAGYIYKDFASRVNDPFYMPNTALTYGGAAGIWYGLDSQLGTAMSMPDKGLNVEVKAMPSPISTEHGIKTAPNYSILKKADSPGGTSITKKCKDVERLLASLDYFYSKEGSIILLYGLDAKNAANDELYNKIGLKDGAWSMDASGNLKHNELIAKDKTITKNYQYLYGNRLPGLRNNSYNGPLYNEERAAQHKVWTTYSADGFILPMAMSRTADEDVKYKKNQTSIDDYVNTMVVKFILGGAELNQTTWGQFKDQIKKYGVEENIAIQQAAYERYNKR